MSPTARTLQYLRKRGFKVGIVERYNQYSRQKNDLFGFIDLVAIGNFSIIGIQCTSTANHATRISKIQNEKDIRENAIAWLFARGQIEIISWRKLVRRNKDGQKSLRPRWAGKISTLSLSDSQKGIIVGTTEDIE